MRLPTESKGSPATAAAEPQETRYERRRHQRVESFLFKANPQGFRPVWLFPQSSRNLLPSLLIDISEGGCRLLIPKETRQLPARLALRVMTSDGIPIEEVELVLEERWSDANYSIQHKIVGVAFLRPPQEAKGKIRRIMIALANEENRFLRCELLFGLMEEAPPSVHPA